MNMFNQFIDTFLFQSFLVHKDSVILCLREIATNFNCILSGKFSLILSSLMSRPFDFVYFENLYGWEETNTHSIHFSIIKFPTTYCKGMVVDGV